MGVPPHAARRSAATITILLLPAAGLAQTTPRTTWGDPDLQGLWSHGTATPLERPERYGERRRLTDAEVAEVNSTQTSAEGVGARRVVWWERSLSDGRTSMIVDPADGRIPWSESGRAALAARPPDRADNPEDRNLRGRCISYGIPRLGGPYSQNIHIAQAPDHLILFFEMVHEFRVVWLDGRTHVPDGVRQWLGDSRGRWEGDTLVVETTHFHSGQQFQGLSMENVTLTERLTRTGDDAIRYAVTFEDASLWTRPWTAEIRMPRTEGPMFEFACHEGNAGMIGLLEAARWEEEQAAGGRR